LVAKKEQVLVATTIHKILKVHESLIKSSAIQIQIDIPSEATVTADTLLLEMILDNLISNALKYNRAEGRIHLSWETANKTLNITDEGIGIDANQLPLLFNRFYRADDSRSSQIHGNGLGLSIAKRLCDVQNIELTVSSIKDKGSTFTLQFPA